MTSCPKCKSEKVTRGKIVNYDSESPATFRPHGLRFLALTLNQGPDLSEKAFACMECGLVWSSTSPNKLAKFIRKHCDKDGPVD